MARDITTRTEEWILEVNSLNAFYGRAQVLFDLSLTVGRGEVVALTGRNGAGKSTTMKAIMGLLERSQGSVLFRGQQIAAKQPYQRARMGMGYVPEDRRIFTDLSVLENLETGRQPARSDAVNWTLEKIFSLFPALAQMAHRPGGNMSGGEQQMLTVARTLMGNPYLILLDEPSEGVAPVIVEQMAQMILVLKREGMSVLLSEQNLHFVQLVSDRAYALDNGHIRVEGSMSQLASEEALRELAV